MKKKSSSVAAVDSTMGIESFELTTADLIVLSLLCEREMHGYELLREFDQQEVTEWARVSRAHVYYALQKLAKLNLIAPIVEDSTETSSRGRTIYDVSALGKSALEVNLGKLEWAQASAPAPFGTWYGLSLHTSSKLRQSILSSRITYLKNEIERKQKTLLFISTYKSDRARQGLDLVRLYIEQCLTELRWIDTLEAT
jgi:DNA-binding PadR family transcriptional regulator